jgi:hypothetical protein
MKDSLRNKLSALALNAPPHMAGAIFYVAEERARAGRSEREILAEARAALGGTQGLLELAWNWIKEKARAWTRPPKKIS